MVERTPLQTALTCAREGTARWLIAHGADIKAEDGFHDGDTVFDYACRNMSFAFVNDLADMLPPEYLTQQMHMCKIPTVRMLVLRGVPVREADFVGCNRTTSCRRELLAWANAELAPHRTYIGLVIGCGVHASRDLPPAQRSPLMKLRGDVNTDARMRIARCLGVRTGAELGRVRRAAEVWSAMPA